jgi:hypothetical protein
MTTSLYTINIGNIANDGSGDSLRTAFGKINNNFTALNSALGNGVQSVKVITVGNSASLSNAASTQMFSVSATELIGGTFQINSSDTTSNTSTNSQNIVINATVSNDNTVVRYNGHSTLFMPTGVEAVCTYNMDISNGNVRMFASHLSTANTVITHTITYTITTQSQFAPTAYLVTESGAIMTTEYDAAITTE